MYRIILALALGYILLPHQAQADTRSVPCIENASGTGCNPVSSTNPLPVVSATSGAITNPTSTLTTPATTTTAYSAGQLIASSAPAGSIVNPSFAIANSGGGAIIPELRLSSNDTASTAGPGATIQGDLWSASPTWTNGSRGTWLPLTGSAAHLGAYTCVMSAAWGDGFAGECAPVVGTAPAFALASGTSIYWSLEAVTTGGTVTASAVFTLRPEILN